MSHDILNMSMTPTIIQRFHCMLADGWIFSPNPQITFGAQPVWSESALNYCVLGNFNTVHLDLINSKWSDPEGLK